MSPDVGIINKYRWSDRLYTGTDNPNTLTRQSATMNDTPRDPLHGPVTWNPSRTRHYSTLLLRLHLRINSFTITSSSAIMLQYPAHFCIRYPTLAPSLASSVTCWQPFTTGLDSQFFDLIRLTCFSI